jgi:hypothetical protein
LVRKRSEIEKGVTFLICSIFKKILERIAEESESGNGGVSVEETEGVEIKRNKKSTDPATEKTPPASLEIEKTLLTSQDNKTGMKEKA